MTVHEKSPQKDRFENLIELLTAKMFKRVTQPWQMMRTETAETAET